ncbi:MAG TPA: DUF721 domain-containing protein [Sphaerochaeta sp.]|nr:DUF721 domain-containing protein [Sphaerochaeta sp.]
MAKDKEERVCKEGEPLNSRDVLDLVLKRLKIDPEKPSSSLGFAWQEIVGDRLYPHVKIVEIQHHTLILRADHPSWAQLALMQNRRILRELEKRYPSLEIRSLHVIT